MFNHGSSFNDFVTQVLNSPSETHLEILPLVLRLRRPRLSLIQERSLIHLMEVALGLKSLRKDPEDNSPQVMTVEDIVTGKGLFKRSLSPFFPFLKMAKKLQKIPSL